MNDDKINKNIKDFIIPSISFYNIDISGSDNDRMSSVIKTVDEILKKIKMILFMHFRANSNIMICTQTKLLKSSPKNTQELKMKFNHS